MSDSPIAVPSDLRVPTSLRHAKPGSLRKAKRKASGRRNQRFPDLNITKLAAQIGVDPTYLGRILSGKHRPGLRYAIKLSKALKISVEEVEKLYGNTTDGNG